MPVFLVQIAPLSDWVNHLGRMQVMAVGASDPYLSAFYSIDWQLIPNLAMDLIVPPLARIFGVIPAGQLFMASIIVLMVTGPFAVQRAVYGKLNPFPLVVFLFLYNDIFLVGLANYLFGVGIAVWGLAVWIWLRERNVALRLGVSFVFVALTYVSHLYAAGVYGLAILAYEVDDWIQRGKPLDRRVPIDLAMIGVPFLPLLPLLAMSATWGLAGEYMWDLHGKADAVLMTFSSYSDIADVCVAIALGVAFAAAWRRGPDPLPSAGRRLPAHFRRGVPGHAEHAVRLLHGRPAHAHRHRPGSRRLRPAERDAHSRAHGVPGAGHRLLGDPHRRRRHPLGAAGAGL